MKDMKKYNGYDELSDRKQMQHWAGSKKFHDDNDKSIAKLEKEKEEKEKRKAKDFKNTAPCYMKPSNTKTTKKKVNENSVVKLNESQLRKIVAESVKRVLKEWEYNKNEGWFLYTEINNDGAEVLRMSDNRGDFDYWRKNGGNIYGQYPSYEDAANAMRYFATKEGFKRANGCFVKLS